MVGPVLIAALACATPSEAPPEGRVLRLAPRQPLALVLNTPSRQQGRLRVSEILDAVAGAFEADTDLSVVAVGAGAASACEGKLSCLAGQAPREASLMMVLSYVAAPPGRPDRLSALLLDLERARGCAQDVFASEAPEACVRDRAVRARGGPRAPNDAGAARAGLAALVQEDFRATLEASGHWQPFGAVTVEGVPPGATILMDERALGVGSGGPVRIEGVPPGTHRVAMQQGASVLDAAEVEVRARAEASATLERPRGGFGQTLLWSGVTLAAIGAGLSVWAIAYAANQPDLELGCAAAPCGPRFYTLSRMVRGRIAPLEEDPNSGAVLGLPLGYSLMLTGGTWAGGALLTEEDATTHWILVGAGVVAGALAYGISAAAQGP